MLFAAGAAVVPAVFVIYVRLSLPLEGKVARQRRMRWGFAGTFLIRFTAFSTFPRGEGFFRVTERKSVK